MLKALHSARTGRRTGDAVELSTNLRKVAQCPEKTPTRTIRNLLRHNAEL